MNPSLAYAVAALHKSAATPAQSVPFMQDPLLMGGVALGAMGGDNPQEMAIKGGLGYLAAKALKQWMEQNGQPVPEALKQNIERVEMNEVKPSDARLKRRNRDKTVQGAPADDQTVSPHGAPTVPQQQSVPTNATLAATDATPMTSTRLRQDIARERSGLGAIKRNIMGSMGILSPEDEIIERNLAAKETQMSDLYKKEQIDNIKMRENAARLKAEQLGLKGVEAENYVANKVPEVRTEMVKEAPKGKYYGANAERAVTVDGKQFYRIANNTPGSSAIYTDHLGNAVSDAGQIKRIRAEIPKTTYKGDIPIGHESAEMRPKTTYATKSGFMNNKHKINLGRGIGAAGGTLLAGTAASAIADKLDLGDTATGMLALGSAAAGGIGGSVLGGRVMGGYQSPFAKINEFGASKPGMSLMQRMKPAGRAAGALALLGGAGWLANKFMKKDEPSTAQAYNPIKEFASNLNSRNYFNPDAPMFGENGLRYSGRS